MAPKHTIGLALPLCPSLLLLHRHCSVTLKEGHARYAQQPFRSRPASSILHFMSAAFWLKQCRACASYRRAAFWPRTAPQQQMWRRRPVQQSMPCSMPCTRPAARHGSRVRPSCKTACTTQWCESHCFSAAPWSHVAAHMVICGVVRLQFVLFYATRHDPLACLASSAALQMPPSR